LHIVERRHQAGEFATGQDNLFGVFDEELEEAPLGGHQAGKHGGFPFFGKVIGRDMGFGAAGARF
jgi:hypothetical protein